MLIKKPADILASEITPKTVYLARRQFIRAAAAAAVTGVSALLLPTVAEAGQKFHNLRKSPLSVDEKKPHTKISRATTIFTSSGRTRTIPRNAPEIFEPSPGPWQLREK